MNGLNTLLLDNASWDLTVDAAGNIAMASPPYAVAQDVASAIRTFLGDCYYDQTQGVPYFQTILGKSPPLSVFRAAMVSAALTVPSVTSAQCIIESFADRKVTGQVIFTTSDGTTGSVSL